MVLKQKHTKSKNGLRIDRQELGNFNAQVKRFKEGNLDTVEFTRFRLKQGVYGQRQTDTQMIRVKIPFGGMTAEQIECLGTVAKEYAPLKKGHLTTRENVQFHHVPLERTTELLNLLADAGLTTREACGNTVRNVVTHPSAGVAKDEVFDVTPYAIAYARYFLRHPITQNMPRKSKTAFSGSEADEAITAIHDVGFIARIENGRKGFKVVAGGGLSIMPQLAHTLYEFVPAEEYLRVSEALLRVYNAQTDERKNLMKARIKFTFKRLGVEKIKELMTEELKGEWAQQEIDLNALTELEDETTLLGSAPANLISEPVNDHKYALWKTTSVVPQRQDNFNMVYVRIERGDVPAEKWEPLANIARKFAIGRIRIDQQQNLVLRWVHTEALYTLYLELAKLGLNLPGRETIRDIVTCPGTDSCKLGITSSMGLNAALGEALDKTDLMHDPQIASLHIKASGCPNSCGQHHIADIGFHGAVIKGKGGQVPAYEIFLGGNYAASIGEVRIGKRLKTRVPAKFASRALEKLLQHYKTNLHDNENFHGFVERVGTQPFEEILSDLKAQVGPLDREHIDNYMDWGKTTLYELQRGEGECSM